jgi:hypothetical protein
LRICQFWYQGTRNRTTGPPVQVDRPRLEMISGLLNGFGRKGRDRTAGQRHQRTVVTSPGSASAQSTRRDLALSLDIVRDSLLQQGGSHACIQQQVVESICYDHHGPEAGQRIQPDQASRDSLPARTSCTTPGRSAGPPRRPIPKGFRISAPGGGSPAGAYP